MPQVSAPEAEDEVPRLRRALAEARAQQAAMSEILRVISSSTTDVQPVFDTIARSAVSLCGGVIGAVLTFDGELIRVGALHNYTPEALAVTRQIYPTRPSRQQLSGRAILDRAIVHLPDILSDPDYAPGIAVAAGWRSGLAVPLIRNGLPIGVITAVRAHVGPFSSEQIELVTNFADQAVIAIENARLLNELRESLQQQTATADVLRAISRSTFDLRTVLDTLIESAAKLCEADLANIARPRSDGFFGLAATYGVPPALKDRVERTRYMAGRGTAIGRVLLERVPIHILDAQTDPEYELPDHQKLGAFHTMLGVPLMRVGTPIGVFVLARHAVRSFTARQIELAATFADQAVIAIENTRLFEEVQARTRDLTEALEQQTATADVLKVINRSALDLQKVPVALVESAARLCDAFNATIYQVDGNLLHPVAHYGPISAPGTLPLTRELLTGRAVLDRRTIHVADLQSEVDDYPDGSDLARRFGFRTNLAIPLIRTGEAVGAIAIRRTEVRPFTDRQVELLKIFADQAVIAIEKTRLFEAEQTRTRELTENLEYQTATSEVLAVISRSPNDLQPVLDAIVATAQRLCQAEYTLFAKRESDGFYHIKASVCADHAFLEWVRSRPTAAGDGNMVGLVACDRQTLHLPDCLAEPRFTDLARQLQSKFRTMLGVPLLRAGEPIGVIFLARTIVQPFTDRQIALVTTFADQAVIAIENTRLFEEVQARTRELTESLQQQTGTADVLKVISRSAFDLQSVLQALVESAARLCDADKGVITRQIDGVFYRAESYGFPAEVVERWRNVPVTPERGSAAGRALLEGRTVHVPDADADPDYTFDRAGTGIRSMLGVPMLREGVPIGVLALARSDVRPFTDKQIELMQNFAAQAVIAIENVRLFDEIQEKSRQLAVASEHKSQFLANMSHELRTPLNAIIGVSEMLREDAEALKQDTEPLDRVLGAGRHLLALITSLTCRRSRPGEWS